MSREAFEKAFKKHKSIVLDNGRYKLEGYEYTQDDIIRLRVYQAKWIGWQKPLAQAPVVAEYIEIGHWYQHEDTGNMGSVDEWQVEQGFFKNNPRLVDCGKVYKLKESK